jgi:hypothetical protein
MDDNYNKAQVVAGMVFIDNDEQPNPAELGAGLMYATLAVADELKALREALSLITGVVASPTSGKERGYVRVIQS